MDGGGGGGGGGGEETWGFKKGPRQVRPADLFRSQKQVEPRLFYSILFGCPRSTSSLSNPRASEAPASRPQSHCSRVRPIPSADTTEFPLPAAAHVQSQAAALLQGGGHGNPRQDQHPRAPQPAWTGPARGHPSPGWGFPTCVATLSPPCSLQLGRHLMPA